MKTTLNPFENAKRTAQSAGGGVSPAVIEAIQAEISILGSQNETQAQDITDIKGSLNSLNDNLISDNNKPFKFSYDSTSQQYGYTINEGGADTFHPFRGSLEIKNFQTQALGNGSSNYGGTVLELDVSNYSTLEIQGLTVPNNTSKFFIQDTVSSQYVYSRTTAVSNFNTVIDISNLTKIEFSVSANSQQASTSVYVTVNKLIFN